MEMNPNSTIEDVTNKQADNKEEIPPSLRDRILSHLISCDDVRFKSQQIGDPDLTIDEKKKILESVLDRSFSTFLSRFGHSLLPEHLEYFEKPNESESYEVQFYLEKLRRNRCKPVTKVQVKNRRYEAMKRLMSEGKYFSVAEMRKRNPLLFDQLLGGFLKNPEIKLDDIQEHHVAHLLLEQIEQDQIAELKRIQLENEMKQEEECILSDEDEGKEEASNERMAVDHVNEIDKDNVILWGKSYQNSHIIGKSRWKEKHGGSQQFKKTKKTHLTQQEKIMLINEFTSSMFSSFLQGNDEFNYSEVDNNPDYDDVDQCELDEQEKYFDSESPEEACNNEQQSAEDDELDKFMKEMDDNIASENLAERFKNMNKTT